MHFLCHIILNNPHHKCPTQVTHKRRLTLTWRACHHTRTRDLRDYPSSPLSYQRGGDSTVVGLNVQRRTMLTLVLGRGVIYEVIIPTTLKEIAELKWYFPL